jgi:ribose 1,5-bisphosphokinase
LVLVVGPSGAGKDTLIDYCRARLPKGGDFVFPRRYVTRAGETAFEDHRVVPDADFAAGVAAGAFALHWRAHGLGYGIPACIEKQIEHGRVVVVNVSRTTVEEARGRFQPLLVVSVTAPRAVLAERLRRRARETPNEIDRRLDRAGESAFDGPDVVFIDNSGPVARAGEALLSLLRERADGPSP